VEIKTIGSDSMIPDWQLPPGTDRGLWDYLHNEELARSYDEKLAGTPLLTADLRFVQRILSSLAG
jgi:hypothetical protein